jgi:fructose-1-phosphate kinase PfkB-like protein
MVKTYASKLTRRLAKPITPFTLKVNEKELRKSNNQILKKQKSQCKAMEQILGIQFDLGSGKYKEQTN